MGVTDAAHVSCFEIFFAFLADGKSRVREFDVQRMLKSRRCKIQNISMGRSLRVHHLLQLKTGQEIGNERTKILETVLHFLSTTE